MATGSGAGDVIGTASIGEDITEQKRAEIKIKRLNRVYAVLSGINTLIVRVRDRDELFREACRIAVESGQFPLAWVAVAGEGDAPCPDCEDNGLSGSQRPGEEFPTGHRYPPVHPGCRCLLTRSST